MDTHPIPEWAFRAPDPLIYSQQWLQAHGLAYTWDNPDIRLELADRAGRAGRRARADARHHLSRPCQGLERIADAPVADLPVEMSYLDFGIGGVAVPIGATTVDLPVKGARRHAGRSRQVDWHTPEKPGHYCLQVRLVWPHDADPGNNLGQHNVDVKPLNSPRATFTVPVRNAGRRPMRVRLAVDA